MKILIVDPCLSGPESLKSSLEAWGHSIATALKTESTLRAVHEQEFDVILVDSTCSLTAGIEVCRSIRNHPNTKNTFVLLYTFPNETAALDAGTAAGADEVIHADDDEALRIALRAAESILSLRRELFHLNRSLKELSERLGEAYKSIQIDLRTAAAIQMSLLPSIREVHPLFRMDWSIIPSSFLAGDTLNYFMVQDRYIIFYHLDVSGHGVAPALLSVTLHHLLSAQPGSPVLRFDPQREVKRVVPPVEVINELNQRFYSHGDSYFTMIYGVLDTVSREIRFCQAGHPSPIKIGRDKELDTVGDSGFPVALWKEMGFDETIIDLQPGEQLVLYSDGILSCKNTKGEPYPLQRFEETLRHNAALTTGAVLKAIQSDLEEWSEGRDFPDDISVLILRATDDTTSQNDTARY